ncbi:Uncharacterized protein OS=Pirellula staleyi (strain ATCC 27377 / DSM 6068 / ICPB 4128) GN=Psta_2985 PE=4 SV=1 [Gemmataceae bacterium]|nr:Uncharacterized protein OS=Pirellula staleyi (strain ATCC 27377 / DSM 6068 / ICPB 4128) GN=Psta_2985 PE=4 SV=1 [Gemmataceae bacterium]VTT97303.1 Uncharacterized protein OS=Pirellula staleyi (strain ATCC 27377 / DSM 6068 / ICPB 4128) GN=Psta_2985 PE=4 SV=1 [Gemmataceae bacterium]
MTNIRRLCAAAVACGAVLIGCGCSSAPAPAEPDALVPHPVTGKVTFDGQPVGGVVVTLFPLDAPTVPKVPKNPQGVTRGDGTFTVSTFADNDGAPAGGYRVLLRWPDPEGTKSERGAEGGEDKLLGWYDAAHSKFDVRVKAGNNDLPVMNLVKRSTTPAASPGIPGQN